MAVVFRPLSLHFFLICLGAFASIRVGPFVCVPSRLLTVILRIWPAAHRLPASAAPTVLLVPAGVLLRLWLIVSRGHDSVDAHLLGRVPQLPLVTAAQYAAEPLSLSLFLHVGLQLLLCRPV